MKKVLIIGAVWPEPDATAAGSRMLQLIDFFLYHNYRIYFACAAAKNPASQNLEKQGIETLPIKLNNSEFDVIVQQLNPETVIFDRFITEEQFGWRVQKSCPKAVRILDTEDLHFVREHRKKVIQTGKSEAMKVSELAKREIASIYRCDLSLIISEAEMEILISQFNISPEIIFYLPFLLDPIPKNHAESLPDFNERRNFICLGNFRHAPNKDAVIFLKENIWPKIRQQLPQTEIHIYGAYPNSSDFLLSDKKSNFFIEGKADSASKVMENARVNLAALRFGAGLKGKFITAIQNGTPTVTTPVGAEGFNGKLDWCGSIQEDPASFASMAVKLYEDENLWKEGQNNGFEIINRRFKKSDFYPILKNRLFEIRNNLNTHRENNFTGAMLSHHRQKSTYFLSKYIETKTELEAYKNLKPSSRENP